MKEFEEQWEEGGGGICGKRNCEKFWRAALEWVKKYRVDLEMGDWDIIEKELETEE